MCNLVSCKKSIYEKYLMEMLQYEFSSLVRLRKSGKAPASRHFVTVDKTVSEQIQQQAVTQPKR